MARAKLCFVHGQRRLLTGTEKKRRALLNRRYARVAARLLAVEGEAGSVPADPTPCAVPAPGAPPSLSPTFVALLQRFVPAAAITPAASALTLTDLGGDSLAAARLCAAMSEACGTDIPLAAMYEYPLGHLSELLARNAGGAAAEGLQAKVTPSEFSTCELEQC